MGICRWICKNRVCDNEVSINWPRVHNGFSSKREKTSDGATFKVHKWCLLQTLVFNGPDRLKEEVHRTLQRGHFLTPHRKIHGGKEVHPDSNFTQSTNNYSNKLLLQPPSTTNSRQVNRSHSIFHTAGDVAPHSELMDQVSTCK